MFLKKVLGRANISLLMLETLVTEIEALLNDRPLAYVSSDVQDAEPLTPVHLLYGRKIITLPYEQVEDDELEDLRLTDQEESQTSGIDFKTFPLQVEARVFDGIKRISQGFWKQ